jgi:hypothetical protein
MRRLQLTAADLCSAAIGGLIGLGLALAIAEAHLRRVAQR